MHQTPIELIKLPSFLQRPEDAFTERGSALVPTQPLHVQEINANNKPRNQRQCKDTSSREFCLFPPLPVQQISQLLHCPKVTSTFREGVGYGGFV